MGDDELWAPPARRTEQTVDLGLSGYTDLHEVARGGDSVVYRARQEALHRDVAIKVLLETDPATLARFRRELELTVRLGRQHPHVVTVLDTATTAQGNPCLVMDFHDLGSLHDRLRSHGPLPVAEVVAAGTAVADALAFAHRHGVLHRDVKPQNVLLLPTSYVLADFGIARMADTGHTASLERFSYRHASPQVLDGLEPVAADDVWSLGSTLFTVLDGRAPFATPDPADDTALGYLRRVRTGERRALRRDDVPAGLVQVVERCLAPDRADRFASAADVHAALRGLPTETRSWAPDDAPEPSGHEQHVPAGPEVPAPAPVPAPDDPAPPAPTTGTTSAEDRGTGAPDPQQPWAPAAPAAPAVSAPARTAAAPAWQAPTLPPEQPQEARELAPSALALLREPAVPAARPTPPGEDDEATGLHPALAPPGPARPSATPADRRRAPWLRVAGFLGGALLVGSAVGLGVTGLLSTNRTPTDPATSPVPTAVDVPVVDDPLPTSDGPVQASVSNPALEPTDVVATDRGTSVELTWGDPTDGRASFVVVAVDPDAPDPSDGQFAVTALAPGVTSYTVEGVDPNAPQVCHVVLALDVTDPEDRGWSAPVCVQR